MTILTAKVAGVKHVIGCTPPIAGRIPNATIAAMHLAGADEIYLLGGVQAIAAMALGTETVPKVDFLAGPGNAFVAEGKRQLFGEVGIDLFAGPTEILIVADEHADPYTCAVDLLSQAEHGPDSPAILVTNSEAVGRQTQQWVEKLLTILPTGNIAGIAWESFGEIIVTDSLDEAYAVADEYAAEHVEILTQNPREALDKMSNYGAIFLGENTCVSYGDKVGHKKSYNNLYLARYTDDTDDAVHWNEPRPAHAQSGQVHRRPLGRQVPAHDDVPGGAQSAGERRAGPAVRTGLAGREL